MLVVRRVVGESMLPALRAGQIVVGIRWFWRLRSGDVVIIRHDDLEKIKRIQDQRNGQIFVIGDNLSASTDSRTFGWLPKIAAKAKVVWPRR